MSSLTPRKVIGLPPAAHYRQLPAASERLEDVCTRLARELPRSLELGEVLELYASSVAKLVDFDQIQFSVSDVEPLFTAGKDGSGTGIAGRHVAQYQLEVGQQRLGDLHISRNKPFGEAELAGLESTMSLLGYPLRNALLYRDAMQAARQDGLTGVGNRSSLNQTLATELALASRHASKFSLLLLDLDYFKAINDTYGHSAGDETLRAVARTMEAMTRTTDAVFRYGGEEFVILLRNTDVNSAAILAERLRAAIECAPVRCNGMDINVTISSGLTGFAQGASASQLLEQADRALYRAKQDGRNRVYVAA